MRAATEEEPRKILHSNIFKYNNKINLCTNKFYSPFHMYMKRPNNEDLLVISELCNKIKIYLCNESCYFRPDGRCEPVPVVTNAIPSTHLAVSGTQVNYACALGYIDASGVTMSTTCDGTSWSAMSGQQRFCEGGGLLASYS